MPKNIFLTTLCVLFLVSTAVALEPGDTLWTRTHGGSSYDRGRSVQQTTDGGYIIAGHTYSFGAGYWDVYLLKTDSSGDTLWTRTYGGRLDDYGKSVQQTSDGGYIIAGETYSGAAHDVYLVKTDSRGDTLWTRTYGGWHYDLGHSVQQTSDGGYIVAGATKSFGAGEYDVYLLKTDSCGDTLWTRTYGGSDNDYGHSVQQTSDGGYIIAGTTMSFGAGGNDFYLLKTDSCGDTIWTRTYGGREWDYANSVQKTSDSGYIIVGWTISFGAGSADVYLLRTDSSGDTLWTRTYGGSYWDEAHSVQQTSDGGYIIAGETESFGAGGGDVYLLKTNSSGDTLWTRTYGGTHNDWASSLQQTSDGGYIIAGSTWSFGAGLDDVYLIRAAGDAVGVDDQESERSLPASASLSQCYPNPFNATTVIEYQLPEAREVTLEVYNLLGEKVAALVNGLEEAGYKSVKWDASEISSGIYFYKLSAGDLTETKRMILVK